MDPNLNYIVAKKHLNACLCAIHDCFRGMVCIFYIDKLAKKKERVKSPAPYNTPIRRRFSNRKEVNQVPEESRKSIGSDLKSCLKWNSLFLAVFFVIIYLDTIITNFYLQLLFAPLKYLCLIFMITTNKVLNFIFLGDIADTVYKYCLGPTASSQSIGSLVADAVLSGAIHWLVWQQALIFRSLDIKFFSEIVYWIHMCLLCSSYSFEYKWCNLSWPLFSRLMYIEKNWPYFIGFGIPLAVLADYSSTNFVLSVVIFAMVFPFFVVSAYLANPVVKVARFPLPIFYLVVQTSNNVLYKVSKVVYDYISKQFTSYPKQPVK